MKKKFLSKDWQVAQAAANDLTKIAGDDVVEFLIELLESKNAGIRNLAALSLRELKEEKALEPLLRSIFKSENRNFNGTMVYALQVMDCRNKLVEMFRILFYESYESKMGAYFILSEQIFEFSRGDLMKIQTLWNKCIANPQKVNGFNDEETKLMMQDTYEGFMDYLKEDVESNN